MARAKTISFTNITQSLGHSKFKHWHLSFYPFVLDLEVSASSFKGRRSQGLRYVKDAAGFEQVPDQLSRFLAPDHASTASMIAE